MSCSEQGLVPPAKALHTVCVACVIHLSSTYHICGMPAHECVLDSLQIHLQSDSLPEGQSMLSVSLTFIATAVTSVWVCVCVGVLQAKWMFGRPAILEVS